MKKIAILTLEPDVFQNTLCKSVIQKALDKKIWSLEVINIRHNQCRSVDDECFGGGPGMLMKADKIDDAINKISFINEENNLFIHMAPRGYLFNHEMSDVLANNNKNLIILCSRYEGVDQRVIEYWNFIEISIGNFILTNGDIAAIVFLDAIIRMINGVVGNKESINNESFERLKYDQYTRPAVWKDIKPPEILTSGHHAKVKQWREINSKKQTDKIKENQWRDLLK